MCVIATVFVQADVDEEVPAETNAVGGVLVSSNVSSTRSWKRSTPTITLPSSPHSLLSRLACRAALWC